MNQEIITVELKADKEDTEDLLVFFIGDNEFTVGLNNPSCQNSLKTVFSKLLESAIEKEICFDFKVHDGYTREMYVEVCREYLSDLEREIADVSEKMRSALM